jgi:hypothetical protein
MIYQYASNNDLWERQERRNNRVGICILWRRENVSFHISHLK